MTELLTVPTHFGDLSELSSGLADRVDEERIILYGPTSYDEGAYVSFEVLLLDGTPALEGIGRVAAAVDGGEARAPETRFDIVFDTLQLEGRSEVVYERIVLARQSMMGDADPPTGEVDVSEMEQAAPAEEEVPFEAEAEADVDVAADVDVEAPVEEAYEEPQEQYADGEAGYDEPGAEDMDQELEDLVSFSDSEMPPAPEGEVQADPAAYAEAAEQEVFDEYGEEAGDEFGGEQATVVAAIEDIEPTAERPSGAPPPSLPDAPQGFELPPPPQGLTRPVFAATWWPTAEPRPEPRMSSGYFDHRGGLPVPEQPPRPDIDPTLRVSPAPRPSGQEADPQPAPSQPPAEADAAYDDAYEEPAHEEPAYDEPAEDGYDAGETMEAPLDYDDEPEAEAATSEVDDVMFDDTGEDIDIDATAHEMSLPEE